MTRRIRTEVEADICDVFYVRITGKTREGKGPLPLLPDDEGVVTDFMEWLRQEKIYAMRNMVSGGGHWEGVFWMKDKERVLAWLNDNEQRISTYKLVP